MFVEPGAARGKSYFAPAGRDHAREVPDVGRMDQTLPAVVTVHCIALPAGQRRARGAL